MSGAAETAQISTLAVVSTVAPSMPPSTTNYSIPPSEPPKEQTPIANQPSTLHQLKYHKYDQGVGVDCLSVFFPDATERANLRYFITQIHDLGVCIDGKDLKDIVTDAALPLLMRSTAVSDTHVISITKGMQSIALLHQARTALRSRRVRGEKNLDAMNNIQRGKDMQSEAAALLDSTKYSVLGPPNSMTIHLAAVILCISALISGQSNDIHAPLQKAIPWIERQMLKPNATGFQNETQDLLRSFLLTAITLYHSPMSKSSYHSIQSNGQVDSFSPQLVHLHRQIAMLTNSDPGLAAMLFADIDAALRLTPFPSPPNTSLLMLKILVMRRFMKTASGSPEIMQSVQMVLSAVKRFVQNESTDLLASWPIVIACCEISRTSPLRQEAKDTLEEAFNMGYIELEGSMKAIEMSWEALDSDPEQSTLTLLTQAPFLPLI